MCSRPSGPNTRPETRSARQDLNLGGDPMAYPHTLIFVDLASDDPAAAGKFYSEVFGWRDDDRPLGVYHRMVPGGNFLKSDGTESEIGNLHLGIFKADNARPHPDPAGVEPRTLSHCGRKPRAALPGGGGPTPPRAGPPKAARVDPGQRRRARGRHPGPRRRPRGQAA